MRTNAAAILLVTHIWNEHIERRLLKLRDEKPEGFDLYVLADCSTGTLTADAMPDDVGFFGFTHDVLHHYKKVGRFFPSFMPGNVDAADLAFFEAHPQYAYCWRIENDVVFTGNWRTLFDAFATSDADLLATSVFRRTAGYEWNLWQSLESPVEVPHEQQLRAFLPISRMSRRAGEVLIAGYRSGWSGHFECVIPTLLNTANLKIEDVGGDGEFVADGNRNRFYVSTPSSMSLSPGTFVFRPVMQAAGNKPDTLWHPVKWPEAKQWDAPASISPWMRLRRVYWDLSKRRRRRMQRRAHC